MNGDTMVTDISIIILINNASVDDNISIVSSNTNTTININIDINDTSSSSIHRHIINTIKHNSLNIATTMICKGIDHIIIMYITIISNTACLCYS